MATRDRDEVLLELTRTGHPGRAPHPRPGPDDPTDRRPHLAVRDGVLGYVLVVAEKP